MMKKHYILLFFVLICTITLQAQNPFAKLGYDVPTATSSKGEFEEFHNLSQTVEIGSVIYDTKMKKIIGFTEGKAEEEVSAITTAMSIDPHCERYYWISPYAFCLNNPIKFIDPDGKDVYRFDDKTGEFSLYETNNDATDQIGNFKKNKETGEYELKRNRKGEAKTRMDDIEKGILHDGINFKEDDNVVAVGGENQATIAGVENFVINLSEMIGKEIAGFHYSPIGVTDPTNTYIGRYKYNTAQEARAGFNARVIGAIPSQIDIHVDFHTHLSRFSDSDKLHPSGRTDGRGDIGHKKRQSANGVKKFIILTKGYAPISY